MVECKFTTKVVLILFLIGSTLALAQVNHRPIEDFTSAQYQLGYWFNGNNPVFGGFIDFGGVVNRYLADPKNNCTVIDLGTTFSGNITEKALPDGTAQVHVVLHGKNAFMRAFLLADGTPVLGPTRAEICHGATPVLGEFLLTIDFVNTAVGAPLPDFYDLAYSDTLPHLQGVLVDGRAQGPLRFLFGVAAGTPGFMHVLQRGPYVRGQGVPGHDYFPAELVDVKALGN